MGWSYLDEEGKQQTPIMGCYGLGISRLLPAIVEESHDERGMILPITVAPYEVHLLALNYHKDENVKQQAEELYKRLVNAGIEVLFDERKTNPGPQFADADLIGIPFRLTVAKRSLAEGMIELKYRDQRNNGENIALEAIVERMTTIVRDEHLKFSN